MDITAAHHVDAVAPTFAGKGADVTDHHILRAAQMHRIVGRIDECHALHPHIPATADADAVDAAEAMETALENHVVPLDDHMFTGDAGADVVLVECAEES